MPLHIVQGPFISCYNRYMRKSVERKQKEQLALASPAQHQHRRLKRLLLWLTIPIVGTACALFLVYSDSHERAAATQAEKDQQALFAKIDKQVADAKQKKIDDAKAAEAAAKAKAEQEAAEAKARAAATPSGTISSVVCDVTNPTSITVVVNKKHCFSPLSWAPSDLVSVDGYLLRSEAANHLQSMMIDAAAAGLGFSISSAYRSYTDQVTTYNNWVAVNGSQAAADTVSARPGYSEHQTGLAADLKVGGCVLDCFASTAQYTWLTQNAANYGFIQRYPAGLTSITGYSPEAWHWRYVGTATAQDMKAKGIQTLEEYLGISGGDYAS